MRFLLGLGLVLAATLSSGSAGAFQQCSGSPALRVFWEKSVLQVGDTFYQMRKENLGKKSARLTGHEMVFVRSKGNDLLIRGGSSKRYDCEKGGKNPGGLARAQIVPYVANKVSIGSGASALDSDKADGHGRATSTGGKGAGRGHGKRG